MSASAAFLGREAELAALESALADARLGRGRLFLLVGEPGIGKTRLADELCARAGGDVRVLWGRCWEAGGAPAYWPWIEALRPLLADRAPAALAEELGADAVALAALIPELRQRLPGLPPATDDSEQARFLLFDAITRFLRGAAARAPIVLVLDDLHVADRPSLRLLEFVARGLRGTRLLVVGTYRDADARLAPAVAPLLAAAEREGQRFPLRRLRDDEVAAYIAAQSGSPPDERMVAAVVRATEGTPLFVAEVVRLVVAEGAQAMVPGRVLVPDGVQPAIRGHLARVSDRTRAVLRVAAVVGREFTAEVVAAASDERPPPAELADALAEAGTAGLVQELFVPPRLRFSHMLVRETIYRDLGAAERERLHGRVALALESLGATPDRLAELSHHFALAGASADAGRTISYCRQAGERALHTYAHEEAATHFQRALQRATADRERADLLLLLADAHQRSGDRASARAACEQGAAVARRLGDAAVLARVALRLGAEFTFGHVDGLLVGLLEEALRGLGDSEPALRARLMGRLAAARQPAPDPDGPLALAREALALARAVGDRPTLAAVLRDARAAHMPFDDLDERLALDLETLAVAYETGDQMALGQSLWRLAIGRLEQGNVAAARGHLDQLDRLFAEVRQPHRALWNLLSRAGIASLTGHFAEADRLFDQAELLVPANQDPNAAVFQAMCRYTHAWNATRLEEMAALEARLTPLFAARQLRDSTLMADLVRARSAQGDELGTIADRLFAHQPPRFSGQHGVAETVARAGRREAAAVMYERLLPWASRFVSSSFPEGSYSHYLGLLAAALGRREDAARHFEAAIALHEKIGARPWVAHSLMAYADLLGEADPRRADELRARARAIAEALGMPGMLARFGVTAAPEPARASPPEPLALVQEGEYWTASFAGSQYRFKDSKGMQIVAYLLRHPGREFHVLHLAGIAAGSDTGDALLEAAAGAAPDAAARAAYRERAEDLQEELREAEANGDLGRTAHAREELAVLADELARGVGLGGRERKTGGSAERARINIQRRISDAVRKIEDACPPLARRLSRALRTGAYCAYEE